MIDIRTTNNAIVCRVDTDGALIIQHAWHGEKKTTRVYPNAACQLQAALDRGGSTVLLGGVYLIDRPLRVWRDAHLEGQGDVLIIQCVSSATILFLDNQYSYKLTSNGVSGQSADGRTRVSFDIEYVAPHDAPSPERASWQTL